MITKILDVIVAIILMDFAIELGSSKESIAMRIIALMLMSIFLTLDKISRKNQIGVNQNEFRKRR